MHRKSVKLLLAKAELITFHVLLWNIFKWSETLMSLTYVNRATMQILFLHLKKTGFLNYT